MGKYFTHELFYLYSFDEKDLEGTTFYNCIFIDCLFEGRINSFSFEWDSDFEERKLTFEPGPIDRMRRDYFRGAGRFKMGEHRMDDQEYDNEAQDLYQAKCKDKQVFVGCKFNVDVNNIKFEAEKRDLCNIEYILFEHSNIGRIEIRNTNIMEIDFHKCSIGRFETNTLKIHESSIGTRREYQYQQQKPHITLCFSECQVKYANISLYNENENKDTVCNLSISRSRFEWFKYNNSPVNNFRAVDPVSVFWRNNIKKCRIVLKCADELNKSMSQWGQDGNDSYYMVGYNPMKMDADRMLKRVGIPIGVKSVTRPYLSYLYDFVAQTPSNRPLINAVAYYIDYNRVGNHTPHSSAGIQPRYNIGIERSEVENFHLKDVVGCFMNVFASEIKKLDAENCIFLSRFSSSSAGMRILDSIFVSSIIATQFVLEAKKSLVSFFSCEDSSVNADLKEGLLSASVFGSLQLRTQGTNLYKLELKSCVAKVHVKNAIIVTMDVENSTVEGMVADSIVFEPSFTASDCSKLNFGTVWFEGMRDYKTKWGLFQNCENDDDPIYYTPNRNQAYSKRWR